MCAFLLCKVITVPGLPESPSRQLESYSFAVRQWSGAVDACALVHFGFNFSTFVFLQRPNHHEDRRSHERGSTPRPRYHCTTGKYTLNRSQKAGPRPVPPYFLKNTLQKVFKVLTIWTRRFCIYCTLVLSWQILSYIIQF